MHALPLTALPTYCGLPCPLPAGGLIASKALQVAGDELVAVLGYDGGLWYKVVSLSTKAVLSEQRGLKGQAAPLLLDGSFVGVDAAYLTAVRGKEQAETSYRYAMGTA